MHVRLRGTVIRVAGDSRPHAAIYQDHLERIINAEQLGYALIPGGVPLVALMLGDFGAEVIRVDPPGGPRWEVHQPERPLAASATPGV